MRDTSAAQTASCAWNSANLWMDEPHMLPQVTLSTNGDTRTHGRWDGDMWNETCPASTAQGYALHTHTHTTLNSVCLRMQMGSADENTQPGPTRCDKTVEASAAAFATQECATTAFKNDTDNGKPTKVVDKTRGGQQEHAVVSTGRTGRGRRSAPLCGITVNQKHEARTSHYKRTRDKTPTT